ASMCKSKQNYLYIEVSKKDFLLQRCIYLNSIQMGLNCYSLGGKSFWHKIHVTYGCPIHCNVHSLKEIGLYIPCFPLRLKSTNFLSRKYAPHANQLSAPILRSRKYNPHKLPQFLLYK